MNVTPDQARDSLREVHEITRKLRKSLAAADASGYLMLWGLVWVGAFLACGFWPERSGMAWGIGNAIGAVGSIIIGARTARTKIESEDGTRQGWRLFGLWVSLFAFVALWVWLLQPTDGRQIATFVCTAIMFLYVVMGLWFEAWFLVWLGLGVTALTVFGYQMLGEHFNFWMAATGGGSLFACGLYIQRAWK